MVKAKIRVRFGIGFGMRISPGSNLSLDVSYLVVGAVEVEHPLRARIALGIRCEARYARIATTQREARALLRGGGQRCRAWVLAALCHHHEALYGGGVGWYRLAKRVAGWSKAALTQDILINQS